LIEKSDECRSCLDDDDNLSALIERDRGTRPMLTWGEVRTMQASGLVDVQSHTSHHGVVFESARLKGFSSPDGPFPLNGMSPCIVKANSQDLVEFRLPLGTPIFEWGPALAVRRRYLDNPECREECVRVVAGLGGKAFFDRPDWRTRLEAVFRSSENGTWETDEERRHRFREDLAKAKEVIEQEVPGVKVRAVAPPWALMHPDIPATARETGHDIVVLAYPFPQVASDEALPLYPRLYGDSIWSLLMDPLRGGVKWMQSRRRAMARVKLGQIP
jgi:hypothetical protein